MNKINNIQISGFRRLHAVDFKARPLMVMIGANSSGKTTLLDAFSLLSASASGNLNAIASQYGGISQLCTRGLTTDLFMSIKMDTANYPSLQYDLTIAPTNTGYRISKEILSQQFQNHQKPFKHIESHGDDIRYFEPAAKKLIRPEWEHNPFETSLSQVPKLYQQSEKLRSVLASLTRYHTLEVSARAPIKLPQQMKPASHPGANGEDLVPYLYYLRESGDGRFDAILDSLKAVFPHLRELSFPPAAAGILTMAWNDACFPKPIYIHELSEGTLRFLWLVSLLHSPNLPAITMIDEPEVSLHPELLSVLAELMRGAARRTQLIVATHSDRFLRFLKPEEILVMELDESGFTNPAWADTLDLEHWLADYSLDEIWQMGRMGGRA